MKFYELLKKYSNEQIIKALHNNYDDIVDESYKLALNELRILRPSKEKQEIKIIVEFAKDSFGNGEDYLQCDGIGKDKNGEIIRWGIEFNKWEDWLAKEIDNECLQKLDELTILAGIMWELTYNGYTQKDVNKETEELNRRIKEIKEHPENLKSWEDVKKELKNN